MKLLTISNAKTVKGEKLNILTGILYLAPANISGKEVCPKRTPGCTISCLYSAGRGQFTNVQTARITKTNMFFNNRKEFLEILKKDIKLLENKAKKLDMKPAVRLNGTSDINWMRFKLMEEFPNVQFYDYTKVLKRLEENTYKNYHLTFSKSESNLEECKIAIEKGHNVAVVFKELPKEWLKATVINGDDTDTRFLDKKSCIVGLKAKGKAKKDNTGFVVK